MEAAIATLVTQFKTFAGKDGSSSTLSRDEFHSLVTSQLPNYVKNSSDPGEIDRLMGSLDQNNDGELTFSEFWALVGKLNASDPGEIDRLMGSLGQNNDGELTFSEFWALVGKLACKQAGFSQ